MRFVVLIGAATSLATLLAACRPSGPTPPAAEFLVSAGDSTLWVSSGSGGVRVRGSPITLARYGGRFYEVFAVDDDRSYHDALIVGVRVYRRDVVSGDSLLIFEDSIIPRIARAYAIAHPGEQPLDDQDEVDDNPPTQATSDVDLLELIGPYLSYRYRTDIDMTARRGLHTARVGVIDLRTGKPVTVADLFGASSESRLVVEGRAQYRAALDSAASATGKGARRAAQAMTAATLDPKSWELTIDETQPSVAFTVPLQGEEEGEDAFELAPIPVDAPDWWPALSVAYATSDGDRDRWRNTHYSVVADYDSTGNSARLSLVDSANRPWPITSVGTPLHRIDWLDSSPIDSAQRRGITRVFNEAAGTNDPSARVARGRDRGMRASPIRVVPAAYRATLPHPFHHP